MLLSSPRNERQRRASLLLAGVLLCIIFANVCASFPAGSKCPHHLDCARERRHFCKSGSTHCGPCLTPLEENEEGRCVIRRRHHPHGGKTTFYPDLDEEIDYLHSVIEKQEVSEIKPAKQSRQHVTSSQTDVKIQLDTPKQKQRNQGHPSADVLPAATQAPPPSVSALLNTPTQQPRTTGVESRIGPIAVPVPNKDSIIIIMITLSVVVGTVAVILAAVFFVRLQKESHLAQKVDYPAFGGGGKPPATANGTSMGDKTLAQSAQMYHYQHQKQQMLSMGKHKPEQKVPDSEATSDEEEVGGDFTVYECPGLAPTGEMEVKNPLFDDSTIQYQGNHK
ncbi:neural proliferation differentiation and control protein 1a isoform X2 [Centroberyx affinis]|uniref:neural proliferation differentiation and control protein 1a isoform X2 n=1 Tax=Centroberyx affinis TaxID=166261 RepID=UPI003A5C3DF8